LDVNDPITELHVQLEATNGATYNKASPLERVITKIEVVDGSEVLFSLPGELALSAHASLVGKVPYGYRTEAGSDTPIQDIIIPFGRYMYDPAYALNPAGHRNLQLKTTWNLSAVTTVGATGYLTGSLQYSVLARVMQNVPAPIAMLTTKDVFDFTSLGSGDQRIEMPDDYPWRALFVRAYESGTAWDASLTNLKLQAQGGRYIPFDLPVREFILQQKSSLPPLALGGDVRASDSVASETFIAESMVGAITQYDSRYVFGTAWWWKSNVYMYVHDYDHTAATNADCWVLDHGWGLHNTFVYPFGILSEPATWLDAPALKPLRLYLTQGNAGAACNVAVQQVRTY